jgi:alkanesulfonate monooxygenase SsuD/methylene tetrahydromethanopterin reductase-like flavin-dependent oxidoreductase (luciferase family)
VGWSAGEVQAIAREAEDAGFDAIFAAEVNNDVMATAQLMGTATPTFIGDDLDAVRETARQNLVLYTGLPFFQRLFRASGFADEADQMERGNGLASLSDRLLDAICLLGPLDRCRDHLATFRAAGVDLPILYPPVGLEGARSVMRAFRR